MLRAVFFRLSLARAVRSLGIFAVSPMASAEVAPLGDVALVPGMPVEISIKTGDHKVMSYLVKPLSDYFSWAFRED